MQSKYLIVKDVTIGIPKLCAEYAFYSVAVATVLPCAFAGYFATKAVQSGSHIIHKQLQYLNDRVSLYSAKLDHSKDVFQDTLKKISDVVHDETAHVLHHAPRAGLTTAMLFSPVALTCYSTTAGIADAELLYAIDVRDTLIDNVNTSSFTN